MAGWSSSKRKTVEAAFYEFLNRCYVNSRDGGRICLGEHLFDGQIRFITEVFDALEADIHKIYVLKSRQLGISTICRALIVFLMGTIRGLKGALVFDTAPNREEARAELVSMISDLPRSLKFPKIVGAGRGNRDRIELEGGTTLLFKSAGVRKSTSGGTLGRSVGLSVAHLSEICSYDNDEGLEAFENSLSDVNPDRLYIYESTARGFNQWNVMWKDARDDPAHCRCIFLGWWSKDSQQIASDDPDFQIYGVYPASPKEKAKIEAVWQQYGVRITDQQLAWVRRKMDPSQRREGDADPEFEGNATRIQEQPWCVTAETRVGTNRGIVPIGKAATADFCSRGKIVAGGPTGKARIWRVRTKLGYEFRGTANHPLITVSGDRIDLSESLGAKIRLQPPLLRPSGTFHTVSWREPPALCTITVSEDLARFIGLFMGDGSASAAHRHSKTEVAICCDAKDSDIVQECKRLFSSVFAVKAFENSRQGWTTVRSGAHHVLKTLERLELLRDDCARTARKVHVPDFIWQSTRPVIREFLRGLFEADGFNAYETNRVALFSKYPDFIADVQLLLLSFGITSRAVSMKKKAGDGHFYTGFQLELRTAEALRFNEEIGFLSVRKRGRYDPVAYEKKWEKRVGHKRPVILFEDEVVAVLDEGVIEEVWNLTVEGEHLFDANGILTHNTEQEAFQQTGAVFFASENLTDITNKYVNDKFQTYMYSVGAEFEKMRIFKADNLKSVELKVWEEPDSEGVYVMGIDPAFGENENNDRSSVQVLRCYADGVDQVAEYAWPLIGTRQFAWAVASLLGWYSIGNAEVRYILELNGPGGAVFDELKLLKHQIESGYRYEQIAESGLRDIFRNVKTYVYNRVDSMGAGANWHFKTQMHTKILIMERLRDAVSTDKFHVRSMELIEEMRSIAREGDKISAPSSLRDDRVLAAALAVYYWESKIRKNLMSQKRTRETEAAKKRLSIQDQVYLFQQNQLQAFFGGQQRARVAQARLSAHNRWRYGR